MRYVLALAAIVALSYLAWPDDPSPLANHFDACTMARYWHDATRTDEAWADVVNRCGLHNESNLR